jgi:hypothetical protein
MKIIKRLPCPEPYAYWEIEFTSSEELKEYPKLKKTLQQLDMTPEKRFEESLDN